MKFLLTTGAQDLIINAMWLSPIINSVSLWGCEKHSFVNQGGKGAADCIAHLPSLRAHFFLCNSISKCWSNLIISDLVSLLLYPPDWVLSLEEIGTEPSSCHTKTSLENYSLTAHLWLLMYHTFQKANIQLSGSGSKMLVSVCSL